jgi:hypothetical protein
MRRAINRNPRMLAAFRLAIGCLEGDEQESVRIDEDIQA